MDYGIYIAVFAGFLVWLALFIYRRKPKAAKKYGTAISVNRAEIEKKWSDIESIFNIGGDSRLKSSIMEADKLVDYVLKSKNINGNTFGERLKNAKNQFKNYEDYNNLWFAHKVRNNIAHEAMHDLSYAEAKKAIDFFKKALKELGALR